MEVNELIQTCGACPSQWEFRTFSNRPVYVRYRWGYLSIQIGDPDSDVMDAVGGFEVFGEELGGGFDGTIGWKAVEEIVKTLPNTEEDLEKLKRAQQRNEET